MKEKNIIMEKIYDITVVLDNDEDVKYLMNTETKSNPYLTIYNNNYLSDRKKIYKLKNEYAFITIPFVEIKLNGELVKTIYKEACPDPIKELINFLNQ